jgi:hypothetical protein
MPDVDWLQEVQAVTLVVCACVRTRESCSKSFTSAVLDQVCPDSEEWKLCDRKAT